MKIDFISSHHKKTKRNYLERVINIDKAKAATIAKNGRINIGMDQEILIMVVITMMADGHQ